MHVDVAFVPPEDPPLTRTCLVVDVLRATSVMAVLFGRGVQSVYPTASVDAARALHQVLRPRLEQDGGVMLYGEVDALPPPGFDYGNSPLEFARAERLAAHAVASTTNGTPALLACREAPLTIAAAPLNAGAAVRLALEADRDVLIVCSGLRGLPGEDDTLAAGMLASRLAEAGAALSDDARIALDRYEAAREDLAAAFKRTEHGERLVQLGFEEDLDECARADGYDAAGVLYRQADGYVLRPSDDVPSSPSDPSAPPGSAG